MICISLLERTIINLFNGSIEKVIQLLMELSFVDTTNWKPFIAYIFGNYKITKNGFC